MWSGQALPIFQGETCWKKRRRILRPQKSKSETTAQWKAYFKNQVCQIQWWAEGTQLTAISRGCGMQSVEMASCCSPWTGPASWRKCCHACLRSYCHGFNSREWRCWIYSILKRKLLGFIQVSARCCVSIGPTMSDSEKSTTGPESQSFP